MPDKIPAAEYIRMSTEHQRYSPFNQKREIDAYAASRGFDIVASYQDKGRSGLTLREREGLRQLLSDIMSGSAPYKAVLVLDVSRWGRFQDPDQAAHYEFICREAGVNICYCAEQFENDGSPTSTLIKHVKRVMAGEYSRELGVKCLAGAINGVKQGYKQGGPAIYGLRRLVVDGQGTPLLKMENGDQKLISEGRVVYVRGPAAELAVVRRIFKLYVDDGLGATLIARQLGLSGVVDDAGRPFTTGRVRGVLAQQLYTGVYTYNKTTQRLHTPRTSNPRDTWVTIQMFDPIIEPAVFIRSQTLLRRKPSPRYTREEMLQHLRDILAKHGKVTFCLLEQTPGPSPEIYYRRFGGLYEAYDLIGYVSPRLPRLRRFTVSRDVMLEGLRRIYQRDGYITARLIQAESDLPDPNMYRKRFGSLPAAYAAAGWDMTSAQLSHAGNARRQQALDAMKAARRASSP